MIYHCLSDQCIAYHTHHHIHCQLLIAMRTLVATMECSTVAGAGVAVSRNKGWYIAASDCLGMVYSGWLHSDAPEVWPDIIVEKVYWLGERNNWKAGKHNAHAF